MHFCKKCVMPDTRPGLSFDHEGVCAACRWFEQKDAVIDWTARERELRQIVQWANDRSHGPWACVLGVSGGKDSTWQACYLRDYLGINPLLVNYASSEGNDRGRKCLENLVRLGFSVVTYQPTPLTSLRLSRKSFFKYGNLAKYQECSLFPVPFRVAMLYEIPLVFFGENPALECGDKNGGEGWDATTIKNNNTLAGALLDPWLGDGVERKDLMPYVFPSDEEMRLWGGKGVFMGYYIKWSGFRNAIFSIQQGLVCNELSRYDIGDHYLHMCLDWDLIPVNAMLKWIKLGFGHTSEFIAYDIREGRLTREEGIRIVQELDGRCHPRYVEQYCRWIGISLDQFWKTVDGFYGPMWERTTDGWRLRNPIWEQHPPSANIRVETLFDRLDTERLARQFGPLKPAQRVNLDRRTGELYFEEGT